MSKGFRLRAGFSMLAVAATSLALVATAGASSGGGVAIQAQDACDPASFNAVGIDCDRGADSGRRVAFEDVVAQILDKGSAAKWRFTPDHVKVRVGTPVSVSMGRGGELHTFSNVTDTGFGPGCVPDINELVFGKPAPAPPAACDGVEADGTPSFIAQGGLFPGRVIRADTSRPGTRLYQCLIHPWMHATVTVE